MIHPTCPTPTPMCTIAQKGNYLSALGAKSDSKNSWIVDSGASDHMTGCHELFSIYNPCGGNLKIRIADGSLSSVAGKGNIKLSNMTLFSVLHVPNLTCNLVSISKLTIDLNCVAKFYLSYCEFQNLLSGRMIGNAKEHEGLYYLEDTQQVNKQALALSGEFISVSSEIMLWHNRLGHPSFPYLKSLFPFLFKNKDVNSFRCETCQIAKHTRVPYPSHPYRFSKPFSLVHSDIWGPSRETNKTGTK